MNLTAVLDATAARSAPPLDRAVSDEPGGAFADVMAQAREDGVETPAETSDAAAVAPQADADTAPQPHAQPQDAGAAVDDEPAAPAAEPPKASAAAPADAAADGESLPVEPPTDGATLPPVDAISQAPTPAFDPDAPDAGEPPRADADDPAAPTDPVAAAFAVADPSAPAVVAMQSNAVPGATPAVDPAPQPSARATATPSAQAQSVAATGDAADPNDLAPAATNPPAVDGAAPAKAPQPTPRPEVRLDAAPITTPPNVDMRPPARPGRFGGDAVELAPKRELRARGVDPNGAPRARAAAARLEALAGAAAGARTDPAALQDTADVPLRVDAAIQRPHAAADAPRDAGAPARLNELAQLHAQRFAGELADRVTVLRSQRLDSATVTLEPRELGRIDIQVRLQADTTHVAFTAQHAAVRDALEGQLPRLRALLEDAGFSLGGVDVAHSGARDANGGSGAHPYQAARIGGTDSLGGTDETTPWRRRADTALIDVHA